MTKDEKQQAIDKVPIWFHSIDCGDGIITNGHKSLAILRDDLNRMALPSLLGKTVLDVGAWDGFFSFAAEELGAQRVLALDHYVWSMNLPRHQKSWQEWKEKQIIPKAYHLIPGNWEPGLLPGKLGFDTAHRIKSSSVEQLVADFMTVDLIDIGQFDIAFFLGVLYHLEEPFRALKRLSILTRELAVIETAAVYLPVYENTGVFEFYEADELGADIGNWFAPNLTGLAKACRAAGFKDVKVTSPYPPMGPDAVRSEEVFRYRLTIHAYK
jgi:tRNA (mo5U34)-methyltransferase